MKQVHINRELCDSRDVDFVLSFISIIRCRKKCMLFEGNSPNVRLPFLKGFYVCMDIIVLDTSCQPFLAYTSPLY